jgi:hypothetical protein
MFYLWRRDLMPKSPVRTAGQERAATEGSESLADGRIGHRNCKKPRVLLSISRKCYTFARIIPPHLCREPTQFQGRLATDWYKRFRPHSWLKGQTPAAETFQPIVGHDLNLATVGHVVHRVRSPGLSSVEAPAQGCQSKSVSTKIGNTCRL